MLPDHDLPKPKIETVLLKNHLDLQSPPQSKGFMGHYFGYFGGPGSGLGLGCEGQMPNSISSQRGAQVRSRLLPEARFRAHGEVKAPCFENRWEGPKGCQERSRGGHAPKKLTQNTWGMLTS